MIKHTELDDQPFKRSRQLKKLVDEGFIIFAGNKNLWIYGTLDCSSGKRMKIQNRVFFASAAEAVELGYRPCGNCLRDEYRRWKSSMQ